MKAYVALFGALCMLAGSVQSLTITGAEVQGDGKDESKPTKEGNLTTQLLSVTRG